MKVVYNHSFLIKFPLRKIFDIKSFVFIYERFMPTFKKSINYGLYIFIYFNFISLSKYIFYKFA
jgi:hypothetical protein